MTESRSGVRHRPAGGDRCWHRPDRANHDPRIAV